MVPGKIESHVSGLVVRTGLVGVMAERLSKCGVDEVSCRVCLSRALTVRDVDHRRHEIVYSDFTIGDSNGVCRQSLDWSLDIEDFGREVLSDDDSVVRILPAALGVQTGFTQNQLDSLPGMRARHRCAVLDDADDRRIGREVVIARKNGFANGTKFPVHRHIS